MAATMALAPYPRDLIGYGGKPPAWKLPNGAKVAVSMVINFEEGAERAAGDGDPGAEKLGEILSTLPPDKWDQSTEQMFAYGMRAGIWRMLDGLERHKRQITFYMWAAPSSGCPGSPGASSRPATSPPATAGCGGRIPTMRTKRPSGATSSTASPRPSPPPASGKASSAAAARARRRAPSCAISASARGVYS
jgi:hypothetical protein